MLQKTTLVNLRAENLCGVFRAKDKSFVCPYKKMVYLHQKPGRALVPHLRTVDANMIVLSALSFCVLALHVALGSCVVLHSVVHALCAATTWQLHATKTKVETRRQKQVRQPHAKTCPKRYTHTHMNVHMHTKSDREYTIKTNTHQPNDTSKSTASETQHCHFICTTLYPSER